MHKAITAALAAASIIALGACNKQATSNEAAANGNASAPAAAGGINGTWKADLSTVQIDQKPDQLLLKDGKYSCLSCNPPIEVAADGAFHPFKGSAYSDSMAVKVVDDHTVTRTSQKAGKPTGETTMTVSADGNTLTGSFKDMTTPTPVTGKYTETRVAAAPAGAHAISGSWKPAKIDTVSDEGLVTTFNLEGDTLHMSTPAGVSYAAKLDGTDAPIQGDPGHTVASVKKLNDNTYQETDKRDGKVVGIATMTLADGKMNVVFEDKRQGSTTKYTATKE